MNDVFTAKHLLIPLMIPLVNYGVPKLKTLWVYLRVSEFKSARTH